MPTARSKSTDDGHCASEELLSWPQYHPSIWLGLELSLYTSHPLTMMNSYTKQTLMASSPAAAAAATPSLLTQVAMAGSAAVITVTFIHPIDVIKVCCVEEGRRRGE
jgi:hypothetical protein